MFKDSNELLDIALRLVEEAIENNSLKTEIVLKDWFSGDVDQMHEICEQLEIRLITELLRDEFKQYQIRSIVREKSLSGIISFKNAPCSMFYNLIWELRLKPK